jgi:hypothetical protein
MAKRLEQEEDAAELLHNSLTSATIHETHEILVPPGTTMNNQNHRPNSPVTIILHSPSSLYTAP